MTELKREFKPEFLNRIDEIIVFKQLTEEEIGKIADLMIEASTKRLSDRNITIKVTKEMKKHIAKVGFDPTYGARPLKRAIQTLIEDKIAEEILDGKVKDGDTAKIDYKDDKVVVTVE